MVLKKYQNPKGGLNEEGREFYKRTEGLNLKAPLKTGNSGRRSSFLARMGNMPGLKPGSTIKWVFYFKNGLYNQEFLSAISQLFSSVYSLVNRIAEAIKKSSSG